MGKSISDRMKGSPDAAWERLKGKHKALGGPEFKPDVTPILKAYHGNFQKYVDLLDDKKKLKAMLDDYITKSKELGTKIGGHFDELAKVQDKDQKAIDDNNPKLEKFSGDPKADMDEPNEALAALVAAAGDLISLRKALWDQINKTAEQKIALARKVQADFKAKSDTIATGLKKLETDADKQEAQARAIFTNYQKIAVRLEHDDWVDEIRSVVDEF